MHAEPISAAMNTAHDKDNPVCLLFQLVRSLERMLLPSLLTG
jgi:hypothetical protein